MRSIIVSSHGGASGCAPFVGLMWIGSPLEHGLEVIVVNVRREEVQRQTTHTRTRKHGTDNAGFPVSGRPMQEVSAAEGKIQRAEPVFPGKERLVVVLDQL